MKKLKISPGDNLEVSRLMPDNRIEIMTGEVLKENNSLIVMKLCMRKILNLANNEFDLFDITFAIVPISRTGMTKIIKLEHASNLAVAGWDDFEN